MFNKIIEIMAHGINAADKRNREKKSLKGWVKTAKEKRYMTDREAIAWEFKAVEGMSEADFCQPHYAEDAKAYATGAYDKAIYGYNRTEIDKAVQTGKKRRVNLSLMVA